MRIAVCEDEGFYLKRILELIQEYRETRQTMTITLSAFSSADELLNFIDENGGFDLYILDIIMLETNGIQLGSALRRRQDNGMIIYLSTSPDFAEDSYSVEAFHYLLKPIEPDSLFRCLDKVANRFARLCHDVVAIKTSCSVRMIPVQNICYEERVGRLVCYHISDGSVINSATFNGTFQNAVAPLLKHRAIIPVGSSFAVNLRYVTEITKHDLIISEKHKIAIPRGKYASYKTAWSDYWLNGGGFHAV